MAKTWYKSLPDLIVPSDTEGLYKVLTLAWVLYYFRTRFMRSLVLYQLIFYSPPPSVLNKLTLSFALWANLQISGKDKNKKTKNKKKKQK